MKKVVVFGAGLVAGAHVEYLLEHGFQVTVASRTLAKAQALVADHANGRALAFDISKDAGRLGEIVGQHELAVSLLPYKYHPLVAQACIEQGTHMVTTSYVKEAMQALDEPARAAGLTVLNEVGVDPGIDHMMTMEVVHRVQSQGGRIRSFSSYAGGLPAPEDNDNPFGYKFSWSPKGVLLAGRNPARFLRDGAIVEIPGPDLFDHFWPVTVQVEGEQIEFEGYPNRDSLPYMETYGIQPDQMMFRGTLRYPGWCPTLKKIAELGLLEEESLDLAGLSYAQLLGLLIGQKGPASRADAAAYLGLETDSFILDNLEWLGLFSQSPLPECPQTPIDALAATMLPKMQYAPGERDMLVLQHQFLAEYPDRQERITSTMIDFGIPHGYTSMARTVGLPAAVAARMILEGEIALRGVLVPVHPEIYRPVLEELGNLDIEFREEIEVLG
ncbi:MAG: saccharopine dehydrogenase NADP-binding domain-containing protein [Chloroflexia bacterium]|nr:saccharopine dehydrogenase NADP-binding domain-containing protein [Chloroflexia bacterium]